MNKYIFKTRPYLYPKYDYLNNIPYDENSEYDWFRGTGETKNNNVYFDEIIEKNLDDKEWKEIELYQSLLPSELEQDLLKKLSRIVEQKEIELSDGERNLIINADYQTLHKNLPDNSVDIVLTDTPYFINYAGNAWDDGLDESGRLEFFKSYFKSLIPKLKPEAVLLVFNDYSNIDIIEKAILLASAEISYDSMDDGNLDESKEVWMENLMSDNRFTILPYLEWAKTNPRPHVHINKLSEYVITAISGYKQFENMLEVYDYIAYHNAKMTHILLGKWIKIV